MTEPQKPTTDGDDIPLATAFYLAGGRYGTHSRPHTPASQFHMEKPRIIDIPPIAMGPNRTGSQRKRRHGAESASVTSESPAATVDGLAPLRTIERPRQAVYEDAFQEQADSTLSLLATANGRTVIDASSPPPIPFARANQPSRHPRSWSPPPLALDEYEPVDDQEAPGTKAYWDRGKCRDLDFA
ncbi:hypothetical protein NEMBOFW57_001886 [Staphylotrichum longicolle]|uniref:Uncharacterized protein n=1 Tax=Staphylotrichum longicolle TaxID=669026 RepID=A0AAD4F2Z0_9PEZI|nr:hypothetical protein NEMBOFW57_001886 [Staphylotrichum longicolle]